MEQQQQFMTTIRQIIDYVSSQTGHPINRDEGIHHGSVDDPVNGVTVCWMATPDALRFAGRQGHSLVIGHESLYYPYDVVNQENPPQGWQEWPTNRQRRQLLDEYNLTFLRLHGSIDEICILDDFAEQIGMGAPVQNEGYVKIYEVEPISVDALVDQVKGKLGMCGVRVATVDPMPQTVRRIGLPWGGMGLFVNIGYQQQLIEQGVDLLIAGETDNYGFRFAQELGIPMIETSHEISENRGLRHFTEMLSQTFEDTSFEFHENKCAWEMR